MIFCFVLRSFIHSDNLTSRQNVPQNNTTPVMDFVSSHPAPLARGIAVRVPRTTIWQPTASCVSQIALLTNSAARTWNVSQSCGDAMLRMTVEIWVTSWRVVRRIELVMQVLSIFIFKRELNPKIKFVLFERTLKITEYVIFQFLIPLLRFWDISVSLICKLHIWRSIWAMTYRRMLYVFAIIKRNHFEVIMCVCFSHDAKHVHFEVISFYNSKDI